MSAELKPDTLAFRGADWRDVMPYAAYGRVSDWCGLWAMEETAAQALRFLVERTPPAQHMAAAPGRAPTYTQMIPARAGKNIAMIRAAGTLMKAESSFGGTSTTQLRRDIRNAVADETVSGILLSIDSPGGTVDGTYDLAADVKAAGRKKPVFAHVDGMAASAAYWMASQANAVYAGNPMAQIGSIGTYLAVYDYSAAAERDGIKVHLFTTGPLKGLGVPGTALTDDHKAHLQGRINEAQTFFDDAVRKGRGLSATQLDGVRTGAAWFAAKAQELRLIDGIKTLDATLAALAAA
jgi:signal peptide peptidase SppA